MLNAFSDLLFTGMIGWSLPVMLKLYSICKPVLWSSAVPFSYPTQNREYQQPLFIFQILYNLVFLAS